MDTEFININDDENNAQSPNESESKKGVNAFSSSAKNDILKRERTLMDVSDFVQRRADMISAHLLLPIYSKVAYMACGDGESVYALALSNPRIEFIGIDPNQINIKKARKYYVLPNLSFRQGDIRIPDFQDESLDAIINSNILHKVYSSDPDDTDESNYDTEDVVDLFSAQMPKLKTGGVMLVDDYMMPKRDEYVLLEFPQSSEEQESGTTPMTMSDADLLVHFSQTARPSESGGCEGFFLEEVLAKRDDTRLFRLHHKWALEFIHRKDDRDIWKDHLNTEFTFFTYNDYQREFAKLGMRMVYTAPYSNPWVVKNRFQGKFQLYNEQGLSLATPATTFFVIAQKMGENESLILEERRPTGQSANAIDIITVRDKESGEIQEIARRPGEYADVIPYRVTRDGRLCIYVRTGYPRPIINAVSRGSPNLDGKHWSGHLIEPITMDISSLGDDVDENMQAIMSFMQNYASLEINDPNRIHLGTTYFPAPDMIEEAIEPVFMKVNRPKDRSWEIEGDDEDGFDSTTGYIMELSAEDIIRASQIGLLPEPRLELHVYDLMRRHNIAPPKWIGETMPQLGKIMVNPLHPEEILAAAESRNFVEDESLPKKMHAKRSVFVEEGKVGRTTRGLSSQDLEFVVTEDGIKNMAVVMPLTKNWDNSLLVATKPQVMSVPQRMGGDGVMINVPSYELPNDIRNIDEAKQYIGRIFGVGPDRVGQLGESYFTHVGMMAQRIYPFVVAMDGEASDQPDWNYTNMNYLPYLLYGFECFTATFITTLARVQMSLSNNPNVAFNLDTDLKHKKLKLNTEKFEISKNVEDKYKAIPSRLMGEREPMKIEKVKSIQNDATVLQNENDIFEKDSLRDLDINLEPAFVLEEQRNIQKESKDIFNAEISDLTSDMEDMDLFPVNGTEVVKNSEPLKNNLHAKVKDMHKRLSGRDMIDKIMNPTKEPDTPKSKNDSGGIKKRSGKR